MTTESKLAELVVSNPHLFAFLWPVALGEPVGPDGEVFEYGDEQLADLVVELFTGETQNWPAELNRLVSLDAKFWEVGRTIPLDEIEGLNDRGWGVVRDALLNALPSRVLACPHCRVKILATVENFHQHYRTAKCWDN